MKSNVSLCPEYNNLNTRLKLINYTRQPDHLFLRSYMQLCDTLQKNLDAEKSIKHQIKYKMTTKKMLYFIILFLLAGITVFGQTAPPSMAMPKESGVILVDKIIQVTNHEKYFVDYCTKKVNNYATENNWTLEKTRQILESIKFKYYNSTIYNSYAFYSIDQLKSVLNTLTLLNKNSKSDLTMILTNSMMQSNLELFVESVIKGKYVTTK